MSCLDDPKFFKEVFELNDKIKIMVKPLGLVQFRELLLRMENGKIE